MTRRERARRLERDGFLQAFEGECRQVISALLNKYMNDGIDLEQNAILQNAPFNDIGTPKKIFSLFGGKDNYEHTIRTLQNKLYEVPPELLYQTAQTGSCGLQYR